MAQTHNNQIVIVEDESDILEITEEVLREEGFEPVGFRNPRQALEYLQGSTPALVLTDLRLPGVSGHEFIEQVRAQRGAALPIAIMSAAADLPEQVEAGNLQVQAILKKPFELDDLSALAHRFATPGLPQA